MKLDMLAIKLIEKHVVLDTISLIQVFLFVIIAMRDGIAQTV